MGSHSCCTVCYPIQMVSQPFTSLDLIRNYPCPIHFLVNKLGEFGALLRQRPKPSVRVFSLSFFLVTY